MEGEKLYIAWVVLVGLGDTGRALLTVCKVLLVVAVVLKGNCCELFVDTFGGTTGGFFDL